ELSRIRDVGYAASKFDIDISVKEVGDYLSLQVMYNPDVYEKHMVESLIIHYRQLLTALFKNPEEKIAQLDYLLPEEKQELLLSFNNTPVEYAKNKTVIDLFEEQAVKTPDQVAVIIEEKELTYRE